jgi:phage tail sheath protein FI
MRRDLLTQSSVITPNAGRTSGMGTRGEVARLLVLGAEALDARYAHTKAPGGLARAQAIAQRLDYGHAQLNRIRPHICSMPRHPTFSDTL